MSYGRHARDYHASRCLSRSFLALRGELATGFLYVLVNFDVREAPPLRVSTALRGRKRSPLTLKFRLSHSRYSAVDTGGAISSSSYYSIRACSRLCFKWLSKAAVIRPPPPPKLAFSLIWSSVGREERLNSRYWGVGAGCGTTGCGV